jgi:IS30 family transposase
VGLADAYRALEDIPEALRKTLTYDQGKEMSYHAALTLRTGVQVYFADPHSPWQRGSNENTNGLLRQYLPKGTDLSVYSQAELNQIALSLNTRPRKRHQFRTPLEVYNDHLRLTEASAGTIH